MRARLLLLSVVLASAGANAAPAPRIRSSTTVTKADGSRLELSTKFQGPERRSVTLNEAAIEVEQVPPDPILPGEQTPPDPIRYRIEGRALAGPGELEPCLMPALLLLTKGYVSARQVFDALGLQVEITQVAGDNARVQDAANDGALLGFMLAQVQAMRPDRAPLVAALITAAGLSTGPCTAPTRQ